LQEKKLIAERQEEMIGELRKKKELIAQKQKEMTEELAKERALFAEDRKHMYDFIKTSMKRFEEVNSNLDSIWTSFNRVLPQFFSRVVPVLNPRPESITPQTPSKNSTLINETEKILLDIDHQLLYLAQNSQQAHEEIIMNSSEDQAFKPKEEKPKKIKKNPIKKRK
jgi:hypothetical protein